MCVRGTRAIATGISAMAVLLCCVWVLVPTAAVAGSSKPKKFPKRCTAVAFPRPFTPENLALAVGFASCLANNAIVEQEKTLPDVAKGDAMACQAAQTANQPQVWTLGIAPLRRTAGKLENTIDRVNTILQGIESYFVDYSNYEFLHNPSLDGPAVTDIKLLRGVIRANGRPRPGTGAAGGGVAYEQGLLYAGLIPGHCDAASRASSGMAEDYPKAVTAAKQFISDSRT